MFTSAPSSFITPSTFVTFGIAAAQSPSEAYVMYQDLSQVLRPSVSLARQQQQRRPSVSSMSSTSTKEKSAWRKIFLTGV